MSFLIHIKDLLNNKEFIYSPIVNMEDGFNKFFNDLTDKENLKTVITDTHCEIFREEQITHTGWVWNSEETKRETLYILTLIEVYDTHSHNSQQTIQTTQTQTETNNQSTQTTQATQTNESLYDCKLDFNFMDFDTNWQCNGESNCSPSTSPRFKTNKFWSEELINELKEKLNLPNFGLNEI